MSKIKALREQQGLTQAALAEISNVSLRTIQKYESGAINIEKAAVGYMVAIADALGVNVKELI